MLFNSLEFALFFPVVCGLYFLSPASWRTLLLLLASCVFYMAFIPAYVLILAVTILIDYVAGIYLERVTGRARLALLWVSIVATCMVLFVFKYFAFFTGSFVGLANLLGWHLSEPALGLILPIGLSFHTFQSLSYVVEVYKGRQPAEHDFITYATYVMFFPQLVAGPIERPQNLLWQFHRVHSFDYGRVTSGLRRMAWGLFKKLVVADRLAIYVNDVYGAPENHNGLQLTIATIFFAYQIYCDFSGYSDIAIGSARVLGFRLMENFDRPYHAESVSEFWRRWHISLSTWFRDYVYVPLGGSRVGAGRRWINILVTFGISGLWHGANWTYVVWGLLNGLYLCIGWMVGPVADRALRAVGLDEGSVVRRGLLVSSTFALTCLAWVLFRAESLGDAWFIYSHFATNWDWRALGTASFGTGQFVPAVGAILALEYLEHANLRYRLGRRLPSLPTVVRWPVYAAAIFVVVMFGVYRSNQFIYFQF
jgi:alginate O-acetyltransferase complex protein AlgI